MRRVLAGLLVVAACVVPASRAAADPPSDTLYGIGATGFRWSVPVPQNTQDGQSAPLVSDGVAYLGGQGETLAVNTADGSVLWDVATPDGGYGRWLDGPDFIVQSLHRVTAYDRATGALRWQAPVDSYINSPVLTGDDGLAFGTSDGLITTIDLTDGQVRWSVGKAGVNTLTADSRTVVATDPSHIEAFDAVSGKRLWQLKYQSGVPVLTQGVLVDGDARSRLLYGIDERTGRILWSKRNLASAAVAGLGGRVLVQPLGEVALLSARTGTQLWRLRSGYLGRPQPQLASSAGVAALLDGAGGGSAHATGRNLRTGHVVWTDPLPSAHSAGPLALPTSSPNFFATVVDDHGGGLVTDFATSTGVVAWRVALPQQPVGVAQLDGTDTVGADAVVLTEPEVVATPV